MPDLLLALSATITALAVAFLFLQIAFTWIIIQTCTTTTFGKVTFVANILWDMAICGVCVYLTALVW